MSLHPVKARHHKRTKYSQLRARDQWKPWKGWNWNNTKKQGVKIFSGKRMILGIVVIAMIIGSNMILGNVFHPPIPVHQVFQTGPDPTVIVGNRLFHILEPSGDFAEWNTFTPSGGDVSIQNCATVYESNSKCVQLGANSTFTAIALTKSAISLSSAASNNLVVSQAWNKATANENLATSASFGWYLTTNAIIPTIAGYDPNSDPSVFLSSVIFCSANCSAASNQTISTEVRMLRNIGGTPNSETAGCGPNAGALYFCNTQQYALSHPIVPNAIANYLQLNYTGFTNTPSGSNCVTNPTLSGSACSFFQNYAGTSNIGVVSTTFLPPFKIEAHEFYYGLFTHNTNLVQFGTDNNNDDFCCGIKSFNQAQISQGITTAGFFQPLVDALVATGVFILGGILKFVGYITPTITSALAFLETIVATTLNLIGGLIGYPTAGTDLFTAINALVSFFGQAGSIFGNIGALFSRFVDANSVYFSWLPTGLSIVLNMLTLALNGISFVLTLITFSFKAVTGVYVILFLVLFLAFTGDDALAGMWEFLGAFEFFVIWPLSWLCKLLNFILDIVTSIIGLIPKPFVQMVAHAFPRIPIVEANVSFHWPRFDMAEIRNGNMLAVWAWFVDFTFLLWYNGVTPALPGSIGATVGVPASTLTALRGMLIIPEIGLIVVSALAFVIWPVNRMLSAFSLDLGMLNFDVSPGQQPTSGPGGIRISRGKKHGFAAKEKGKPGTGVVRQETAPKVPNIPSSGGRFAAAKQKQAQRTPEQQATA